MGFLLAHGRAGDRWERFATRSHEQDRGRASALPSTGDTPDFRVSRITLTVNARERSRAHDTRDVEALSRHSASRCTASGSRRLEPRAMRGHALLVSTRNHLAVLTWIDALFERYGIQYWLFGGWAVDFHAGAVTRSHDDIDVAVWALDVSRAFTLLEERGWTRVAEHDGYTVYEHDGVRLELVPLARDEYGIVYTPLREGRAFWPESTFGKDVGELDERRIRVISLAALRAEKSETFSDPNVEAKNAADLATLDRLG